MKSTTYFIPALLISAVLLRPTYAAEWIGPDQKVSGQYQVENLERLLDLNRLAREENIKVVPLSRNEHSASLLVQVRDREPLHWHADSDITVFMLRGEGDIRLGDQVLSVKSGDVIHVPRGEIHAFINRGPQPAAALVVYSPAPGPEDRVLVKDSK